MSAPFVPDPFVGGQMTDLPVYAGGLDLTALFEIVSPGNPSFAVNYRITLSQLAIIIGQAMSQQPTIVTSNSYASVSSDTRILVELAVPATCTIIMLSSSSYSQPILVKDAFGTAAIATPINISFSGGQTADGLTTVPSPIPTGRFGSIRCLLVAFI